MKNKIFIAIIILFAGCQQNKVAEDKNKDADQTNISDTFRNVNDSSRENSISSIEKNKDSSVQNYLKPGSDTLFLKLSIDSFNQHAAIPVLISSGKKLFVVLSSNDTKANIRISQIELPDSTFDGPFGKNLQYKIKSPGNYKIIIDENMMAGDRWKGDFTMKAWVQ